MLHALTSPIALLVADALTTHSRIMQIHASYNQYDSLNMSNGLAYDLLLVGSIWTEHSVELSDRQSSGSSPPHAHAWCAWQLQPSLHKLHILIIVQHDIDMLVERTHNTRFLQPPQTRWSGSQVSRKAHLMPMPGVGQAHLMPMPGVLGSCGPAFTNCTSSSSSSTTSMRWLGPPITPG